MWILKLNLVCLVLARAKQLDTTKQENTQNETNPMMVNTSEQHNDGPMEKLNQATSEQGTNEQHSHGPIEKLEQATGEQQNHDPMERLNQATREQHNHGPKEKIERTFKSSKDVLKENIRSKKMLDSMLPYSSRDDGEEDSDDEEEDSDDEEDRVKRQVDQVNARAKQLDMTKHENNTNETNHSEQQNHGETNHTKVDSSKQHNHGPMEKLKGAFKSSKDAVKEHIRSMVVDENQILLEEIVASAHGRSKKMFDSDVPNSSRDDEEEDSDDEEEDSDDEGGRAKRQVDQEDIRHALCKDKNAGEFFRLVAGSKQCRDVVSCTDEGLQALRCPPGLAFDLEKQTCEWKDLVNDCNIKARPKLALPKYNTDEPLCSSGELSCGDGQCLPKLLFCDDKTDCVDGSDENLCDSRNDPNKADECDPSLCSLPNCYCSVSGTDVPGGLDPQQVPQMIMLTFDDAINDNNLEIYEQIFDGGLKNPNGCDVKATFFVSHEYNNYSMVQELHRRGHEMAAHSITHDNEESYWDNGTELNWSAEMGGLRDMLSTWGNVPAEDIYGSRAPLLRLGGNRQFSALEKEGFVYDSSMVAPLANPPLWPYPLAFSAPHRCHGNFQKCPTRSHSIMEMVMNEFDPREEPGSNDEEISGCVMLDSCSGYIRTPDNLYNVLTHNMIRHYEQNRAPLGMFLHAAWLKKQPEMLDALLFWMDEVLSTYSNVYFVTMSQVLAWMQSPVDSNNAVQFPLWKQKCSMLDTPSTCAVANNCPLSNPQLGGVRKRLQTCNECPAYYPWLNDVRGQGEYP